MPGRVEVVLAYVGRYLRSQFLFDVRRLWRKPEAGRPGEQWHWSVWAVELVALYVLIFLVDVMVLAASTNLFAYQPHPFWIPVVLVSLQYGFAPGMIAALSAILLHWLVSMPAQVIGEPYFEFVVRTWATPTLWLCAAFCIGQVRQLQLDERNGLYDEVDKLRAQAKTLTSYATELKEANANLQLQITTGKTAPLEHALIQLSNCHSANDHDFHERVKTSLDLLIGPNKSSVFVTNSIGRLVLSMKFGWYENEPYLLSFDSDHLLYQSVINNSEAVSLSDEWGGQVFRGEGKVAVPIQYIQGGGSYGMLKVEEADNGIWSDDKLKGLTILAREIGIFLERLNEA